MPVLNFWMYRAKTNQTVTFSEAELYRVQRAAMAAGFESPATFVRHLVAASIASTEDERVTQDQLMNAAAISGGTAARYIHELTMRVLGARIGVPQIAVDAAERWLRKRLE